MHWNFETLLQSKKSVTSSMLRKASLTQKQIQIRTLLWRRGLL